MRNLWYNMVMVDKKADKRAEAAGGQGPVRYFNEQFDDEEVMLVFRKHALVMRKGIVLASLGLLVPVLYVFALTLIYANNPDKLPSVGTFYASLGVGAVLALIIMFPFWISWWYSVYIVTNQRLIQITQKGLLKRSVITLNLEQVQMVSYEVAGLEQTMLGFGTMVIQTFVGSLTIHDVHHPAKLQRELLEILRKLGIKPMTHPGLEQAQTEESEDE